MTDQANPIQQMQQADRHPAVMTWIDMRCSYCHKLIEGRLVAVELGGIWCSFHPDCEAAERTPPCPTETS